MPKPPKVLVAVPDDASLTRDLREAGWDVVLARDAQHAYSLCRQVKPAFAVLDSRLNRGGALVALKWIKSSVHAADIQVIALASPTDRDELLKAGALECLGLSADPATICAAIRAHLGQPALIPSEAPGDELRSAERMAALRASCLLDGPPEEAYDSLTRLAASLLGAPVALLSLVDTGRQFFKSQIGLPEPWAAQRQTPLSHSFCQWVVSGREPMVIEDARMHPVLKSNLAIRDLGVIAYAGIPVRSGNGHILGSMCTIDVKPRQWTAQQLDSLKDLTYLVEAFLSQAALARDAPRQPIDLDRAVAASGDAVSAAVRILRRERVLNEPEREVLLGQIEQHGQHLVRLNQLIRVLKTST